MSGDGKITTNGYSSDLKKSVLLHPKKRKKKAAVRQSVLWRKQAPMVL